MGRYLVWEPAAGGIEESANETNAPDARTAASDWADNEDYESDDFTIASGIPATVVVRDLDTGKLTEWIVHGKAVRDYTAVQKTPEPETADVAI